MEWRDIFFLGWVYRANSVFTPTVPVAPAAFSSPRFHVSTHM